MAPALDATDLGMGEDDRVWLAVAAISLAVAIGFNILALAIQDREH